MTQQTMPTAVSRPGEPRPVTPMGIVVARLHELVDSPDVIGTAAEKLREVAELAAGLDTYVERHTTAESPALRALADRTATHEWRAHSGVAGTAALEQEMLSGHVEGQLLKILAHAVRARRVLEIGMFTGYATLALAEVVPADGTVVACEIDPVVADVARESFAASPAGARIDVRVGPALHTLAALTAAGERFDLVFVDADKGNYLAYLDAVLDGDLLADHGLICIDNTLMQGQPWTAAPSTGNGAAIAAFNDAVTADPRVEQVLIPLRDGLTLIRRTTTGR